MERKTSTWWACPLELMGLKQQSIYVECSSTGGPGELRRPSPCLSALLIIPFKWNVNPRSPWFLPCQYLFDSRSAPPSIQHLLSLPDSLSLYTSTLFLSLSLPPPALAPSSYLLLFSPSLPLFLACQQVRLMDTGCSQLSRRVLSCRAQQISLVS